MFPEKGLSDIEIDYVEDAPNINSEGDDGPVAADGIVPTSPINNIYNSTRNKFFHVLYNLSSYLPFSVEYAVTVGRNCNIIEYNHEYYGVPGLVISAMLFIIGVLFCFVGKREILFAIKDQFLHESVATVVCLSQLYAYYY